MAGATGKGGILGGGGVAQQFLLWGIVSQLASGILAPIVTAVQQQVYSGLTTVALTPAQVADLVLKGWWDMERGTAEANKYGISSDRFQAMVDDAGEPPALQMLLQAYRRQIIGWDSDNAQGTSVLEGIKQSRLRDQWADMVQALVVESLGMAARSAGFAIPAALGVQEGGFVLAALAAGVPATAALPLVLLKRAREVSVGLIGIALWRVRVRYPAA